VAIPRFIERRHLVAERAFTEQLRLASGVIEDLQNVYSDARQGRGTLDFLQIIIDPEESASRFREMLAEVAQEYVEFSRPPFAADQIETELIRQARERGVHCRLLVEPEFVERYQDEVGAEYTALGVEIRQVSGLPMKLAVFDGRRGLIALLDPTVTNPVWTTVVFEHDAMGQAMQGLFENHWSRAAPA